MRCHPETKSKVRPKKKYARDGTKAGRPVPSRLLKSGTDVRMRILISIAVSVKTNSKCKKQSAVMIQL